MSAIRYTELGVLLENRIYSRAYTDKIPPQRELQREFSASPVTVSRAVQLLVRRGLLRPGSDTPRCGMNINPYMRSRSRGVIAVAEHRTGGSFKAIEKICRTDGFEVKAVNLPDELFPRNLSEIFAGCLRGVLFILSSISVEAALYLQQRKIPFVAGNILNVLNDIDFVEQDHESCWRIILGEVKNKNYRKVCLCLPGRVENFYVHQSKIWRKLLRELDLQSCVGDNFIPDRFRSHRDNVYNFFRYLHKNNDWPEALLMGYGMDEEFYDSLQKEFGFPRDMLMISCWNSSEAAAGERNIVPWHVLPDNYNNLFAEMYMTLRERLLAPELPPFHRFVPYLFELKRTLPERGMLHI